MLERVERLAPALEQHVATLAREVQPDAIRRVLDGNLERQTHRAECLFEKRAHAPLETLVQFHYLRSFACGDFPAPAFFN